MAQVTRRPNIWKFSARRPASGLPPSGREQLLRQRRGIERLQAGDKKEGSQSWAKVKFDRQIIAIAKVEGAELIYSEDSDIRRQGEASGLKVLRLEDLEDPPAKTPDLFGGC
ncbi:hypothetical protein [Bradyrhizobium sp.]|uniref:hypothetical protein n=1 Tax=Bradyrhizobium sp. TaxID=376 RepID=UPI003C5941A8